MLGRFLHGSIISIQIPKNVEVVGKIALVVSTVICLSEDYRLSKRSPLAFDRPPPVDQMIPRYMIRLYKMDLPRSCDFIVLLVHDEHCIRSNMLAKLLPCNIPPTNTRSITWHISSSWLPKRRNIWRWNISLVQMAQPRNQSRFSGVKVNSRQRYQVRLPKAQQFPFRSRVQQLIESLMRQGNRGGFSCRSSMDVDFVVGGCSDLVSFHKTSYLQGCVLGCSGELWCSKTIQPFADIRRWQHDRYCNSSLAVDFKRFFEDLIIKPFMNVLL